MIILVVKLWRPSDAYMHQETRPSLVHIMASYLFGTKALSESMLANSWLDSWEQISIEFESKLINFRSQK